MKQYQQDLVNFLILNHANTGMASSYFDEQLQKGGEGERFFKALKSIRTILDGASVDFNKSHPNWLELEEGKRLLGECAHEGDLFAEVFLIAGNTLGLFGQVNYENGIIAALECIKSKALQDFLVEGLALPGGQKLIGEKFPEIMNSGLTGILSQMLIPMIMGMIKTFEARLRDPKLAALFKSVQAMNEYGHVLLKEGHAKGNEVIRLSQHLNMKALALSIVDWKVYTPEQKKAIVDEFTKLAHSKDELLQEHRAAWKPIVANILLALTGIGLIAIAVKAVMHAVESSKNQKPMSLGGMLFFAEPKSARLTHAVVEPLAALTESLGSGQ